MSTDVSEEHMSAPSSELKRCEKPATFFAASCWFLAWFTLQPWRWRRHIPPKTRLNFNRLHDAMSQAITTAVKSYSSVNRLIPLSLAGISKFYQWQRYLLQSLRVRTAAQWSNCKLHPHDVQIKFLLFNMGTNGLHWQLEVSRSRIIAC
jgi:hypothetical protein